MPGTSLGTRQNQTSSQPSCKDLSKKKKKKILKKSVFEKHNQECSLQEFYEVPVLWETRVVDFDLMGEAALKKRDST